MNFTIFFEYVATVIEAYIGVRFLETVSSFV